MAKTDSIQVFIASRETICGECKKQLDSGEWITLQKNKGALCLGCADLDHLVYLAAGDAALSRRSRKHSRLSAVVLKWVRRRKRYERQGILIEEQALERAEQECDADADKRAQRRKQSAERRAQQDKDFVAQFGCRIRMLFPNCPPDREHTIAHHACLKYSGRVGRSAAAKQLNKKAVLLAVRAHIRHTLTPYDDLLMQGINRCDARDEVQRMVDDTVEKWMRERIKN
ncbi:MAG: DUF2293 domain-containing protein [Chitinivibrionales bacterium]